MGSRGPQPRDISERFWEKVDRDGPVPEACPELGPCWLWTASTPNGYGQFMVTHGVMVRAYVVAWELVNGPIPAGLELETMSVVTPSASIPAILNQ